MTQKSTPPSTVTLVLAIIASGLVTILMYGIFVWIMEYFETAAPSNDPSVLWLLVLFVFAVFILPGIIVAAIIWPRLRKK